MVSLRIVFSIVAILCVGILTAIYVQAQNPAPSIPVDAASVASERQQKPENPPFSLIEKVSPGVFRLGDIRIDREAKTLTFPATVNMDKGLLEYLIVASAGKTHESLLRTNVQPYHLQIAFLLVGFEGTDRPIHSQGAREKPKGDLVEIAVEYAKEYGGNRSQSITARAEEWIVKRMNDRLKEIERIDWVYTGSTIIGNQFAAQSEGSIIAIYRDPVALVDHASEGGEDDEIWFVKEGSVPPVGTKVMVTIRAKR